MGNKLGISVDNLLNSAFAIANADADIDADGVVDDNSDDDDDVSAGMIPF